MTSRTTRPPIAVDELPGPVRWPLFGNALQMPTERFHQILEGWFDKYGDPFRFSLGHATLVAIADPQLVRQALQQRPGAFRRTTRIETCLNELRLGGVFSSNGDDWKRQRRLITPSLRPRQLSLMYPTVAQIAHNLLSCCERAAQTGEAVDIVRLMMKFTVDVTTEIAFGRPLNTLLGEHSELQEHLARVFPGVIRRVLAPVPYWRWFKLPRDRALERSIAVLMQSIGQMVEQNRQLLADNPQLQESPQNILQVLLTPPEGGEAAPTDEEIFGNAINLLLAGEDTTADGLAWAFHHLALDPDLQAQAAQEARLVLNHSDVPVDMADLAKLPLCASVGEEVLRMRSPAPFLFVEATEDTVLGHLRLRRGQTLAVMTRHVGMNSSLFSQPNRFYPQRWLPNHPAPEQPWNHTPRAQLAFGSGPRVCPGRSLAMLETQLVLSSVLRRFEVTHAAPADQVVESLSFTMYPKNLRLRLRVRSESERGRNGGPFQVPSSGNSPQQDHFS